MGVFGPGVLLDPATMRPVAGRVLTILERGTDLPLVTDPAVVATNVAGYYPQFTVADQEVVLVRAGRDEVIAALDRAGGGVTELEALTDVDVAGAQDGDALTFRGGQWVSQSGTSGTVTSVNGVEPDEAGNVTIGNVTIAAGAGIDVSYDPTTDTYTISAAGGGSGGDETLTITNHGGGTVTYSGTSVIVSGDGTEFTIDHPGIAVSGDGLTFTATTA